MVVSEMSGEAMWNHLRPCEACLCCDVGTRPLLVSYTSWRLLRYFGSLVSGIHKGIMSGVVPVIGLYIVYSGVLALWLVHLHIAGSDNAFCAPLSHILGERILFR